MKKTVAIALYFFIYVATFCQVGIGTTTPDPSAALDVSSNAKGLLIPQMTQVQRRAIDKPATGLFVAKEGLGIGNSTPDSRLTIQQGMRATGGGGGHRDYRDASQDIVVNYSGPDPDNPETHWRVIVGNKDLFAFRDVRIYVLCAKIQ